MNRRRIPEAFIDVPEADLFDADAGVPVLVVTFLAILELARETLVQVTQQSAFSPIYVKLNHGLAAV